MTEEKKTTEKRANSSEIAVRLYFEEIAKHIDELTSTKDTQKILTAIEDALELYAEGREIKHKLRCIQLTQDVHTLNTRIKNLKSKL